MQLRKVCLSEALCNYHSFYMISVVILNSLGLGVEGAAKTPIYLVHIPLGMQLVIIALVPTSQQPSREGVMIVLLLTAVQQLVGEQLKSA